LLRFVRMLLTGIDVQVGEHLAAQFILGQHTLDGVFENALRVLLEPYARGGKPLTTGVTRVADIDFVGHLGSGQAYLLGIDDNHVVSTVNVGRKVCFVFAAYQACDLAGQPTKHFALGVNHNPLFLHRFLVGRDGFVTERIHYFGD